MITFFRALAVLSAITAATPTLAHVPVRTFPPYARDFEAVTPRASHQADSERPISFGVGDDSHDTATGGPAGGLIDKN